MDQPSHRGGNVMNWRRSYCMAIRFLLENFVHPKYKDVLYFMAWSEFIPMNWLLFLSRVSKTETPVPSFSTIVEAFLECCNFMKLPQLQYNVETYMPFLLSLPWWQAATFVLVELSVLTIMELSPNCCTVLTSLSCTNGGSYWDMLLTIIIAPPFLSTFEFLLFLFWLDWMPRLRWVSMFMIFIRYMVLNEFSLLHN